MKIIHETIQDWMSIRLEDDDLQNELNSIKGNEAELYERFYQDLHFGTGGLRGIIGVGTNRMNIYTVAKASQGYADYLTLNVPHPSIAIAYDSRTKSDIFARIAAEVFAANGISVYIFSELAPTPLLSFSIRYLQCSGGIVVTSSHNPAEYNGYKVYNADGCQITMKTADSIQDQISKIDIFKDIQRISFDTALQSEKIKYIPQKVYSYYLHAVSSQSLLKDDIAKNAISIIYTPLNGTGLKCVYTCLRENGFQHVHIVEEQKYPDERFPTCPHPNPEENEALALAIRDAQKLNADIVLATDPDCDRLGIAVRYQNSFKTLTGNEVGILLFDFICKQKTRYGTMPDNPILYKSIVTTDMVKKIAKHYNVEVREVLTGFKFIGEKICNLERQNQLSRFILGFEESYGYLTGSYVRDKDGVNASLLISEMCAYYKKLGYTLHDALMNIYALYGYCIDAQKTYSFKNSLGIKKMNDIMEHLRKEMPNKIGNRLVTAISDYKFSMIRYPDGNYDKIELPSSNVIKIQLEGNHSIIVRPSGTEPKLKIYYSVYSDDYITALEQMQTLEKNWEEMLF